MSTTTSVGPSPTGLGGIFSAVGGNKAGLSSGQTVATFFSALVASFIIFGIQAALFLILKDVFPRIYAPRTFLVPARERTKSLPRGLIDWIKPVFSTPDDELLQKCGLDAFFFIRYLRLLLKIFIPLSLFILPLLLPLNAVGGRGPDFATGTFGHDNWLNVTGMDVLSWGNVRPDQTHRYWGHLVAAIVVTGWVCYIFYDELRGYIRIRQAYLTSPQHRLRASATTVLVQDIPEKWCTRAALEGLYDVFPGGLRNVWINRNFDDLSEKVRRRNELALALESAETSLIRNASKAHATMIESENKKQGAKLSRDEKVEQQKMKDEQAALQATMGGVSTGNPHQIQLNLEEPMPDDDVRENLPADRRRPLIPIPVVGQGIDALGQGFAALGKTVWGGLRTVGQGVDNQINTTHGLELSDTQRSQWQNDGSGDGNAAEYHGYVSLRTNARTIESRQTSAAGVSHAGRTQSSHSNDTEPIAPSLAKGIGRDDRLGHHTQASGDSDLQKSPPKGLEPAKRSRPRLQTSGISNGGNFDMPCPVPHISNDEYVDPQEGLKEHERHIFPLSFMSKKSKPAPQEYPPAYDDRYDPEQDDEPRWKKYLKSSDRETMRLPIFGWAWMITLPLIGKKVDTITYCRKEVARLNVEIELDQKNPEQFPVMSSAFVQFNHQVAAHMACQSVSHHVPNYMSPRVVEISPNDVIWDNMSIKWWERYLRTVAILAIVAGLIFFWTIPVFFTGLLSQVAYLQGISFLAWLSKLPPVVIAIVQGILPPLLLAILIAILPLLLRLLARLQGAATGAAVELAVQDYYFFFLFFQVFIVVTLSSAFAQLITAITSNPQNIPTLLATKLPQASNYFFSYLLLQALSQSSGALLQVGGLLGWFILSAIFDTTARQKWSRQITLPNVQWGSFFPFYTNLAAIGLIYSVVSPLMLLFNVLTFALFWLVYRYNTLYVTKFTKDTGGLLFPKAIHQLFIGLYIMQICLIGLFLLVTKANSDGSPSSAPVCFPQAIVMLVLLILTILFQWLINRDFAPLYRYLPITLEDDAVLRDEEFAHAQRKKWGLPDIEDDDQHKRLKSSERMDGDGDTDTYEMQDFNHNQDHSPSNSYGRFDPRNLAISVPNQMSRFVPKSSWAARPSHGSSLSADQGDDISSRANLPPSTNALNPLIAARQLRRRMALDNEAQTHQASSMGDALFAGIHDEIEDLTSEERDKLVRRAFQHEAMRARRPVIWIPRDDLGVSDDEIRRTQRLSENIWISNEYTGLNGNGEVIFKKSPPDFSEIDLIEL